MGIFDIFSQEINHFNSVNIPLDNSWGKEIRSLDESTEKIVVIWTFGITQKVIDSMFCSKEAPFKSFLGTIDLKQLDKVYQVIFNLSASELLKSKVFNIKSEPYIANLAKVFYVSPEQKNLDINEYMQAESGVMRAYENICSTLNLKESSGDAITFGTSYTKIFNEVSTTVLNFHLNG